MERLKQTKRTKANAKIKGKQAERQLEKNTQILIDGAQLCLWLCARMLISDVKNAVALVDLENR